MKLDILFPVTVWKSGGNLTDIMKYSAFYHAKGLWFKPELYFKKMMKLRFK